MRTPLAAVAVACLAAAAPAFGEIVAVKHQEGLVHGFLVLSDVAGKSLADGTLVQHARGARVTSRLSFRFRDGSSYDETSVYTQDDRFLLVSNRTALKGPAFPWELESSIDVKSGRVSVRYRERDEKEGEAIDETMALPDDLANGLMLTLLKNISPETPKTVLSMLAITPKPRLVKLEITPDGQEPFATGGSGREATRFRVKVDIPGVTGVLASVFDKTPPDSSVWILGGDAPAFLMSLSPLYVGGPLWRIELVSPTWPRKDR